MGQTKIISLSQVLNVETDDIRREKPDVEKVVENLYLNLRPALLSYVYYLVSSTAEAEDLIQIAFLQFFDQLEQNKEIHNPRAWLYRVVHNLAIEGFRRTGSREKLFQQWLSDKNETSYESAEDEMIRREQIERSLQILNERERHCLMLRAEGLSYQEIADILEISAKSVSVYLARGLKKIESKNA